VQIGFIRQEKFTPKAKAGEEVKEQKWLECHMRIAGLRPFNAKISKNKRKEKESEPDFNIYLRSNVNKNDSFRDIAIGALWLGEKMIDGVLQKFMTGNIEVAFNKVSIAVWAAKPNFEGEVVKYLYDIKTMKDTRNGGNSNNDASDYGYNYAPPEQEHYEQGQPQEVPVIHKDAVGNAVAAPVEQQPTSKLPVIDIEEDEIPF